MLTITPFEQKYIPEAAGLFIHNYQALRRSVPILPNNFENLQRVAQHLEGLFAHCPGAAALEDGRLVGYMGWYLVADFRNTRRLAAYCPEWGHAAAPENQVRIYRALYRAASAAWFEAGCQSYAISLLAHDPAVIDIWFWNGFGLGVVNAVRPMQPLKISRSTDLLVRRAIPTDAETLAELESEHARYYIEPPTLMEPFHPAGPAEFTDLLNTPPNSAWLAWDGTQPAGYLRFEGQGFGAAEIVSSATAVANTGAYIRPAYRRRGAAPAMLDAALRDYAARGFTCCSVDFEAFNPEAAAFWPRYFEPVVYSVFRVPERQPTLTK